MYDVAAQLATTASTNLYTQLRGLVTTANGENAANMLFQSGGPEWIYPELSKVYGGTGKSREEPTLWRTAPRSVTPRAAGCLTSPV